jgi:hypothetical protein
VAQQNRRLPYFLPGRKEKMDPILGFSMDDIIRIGIYVGILLVIWTVFRTVFRLTMRVFQFGCLAIVLLGVGLFLLNMFGGQ